MNQITENNVLVTTPEQAVEEFVGEQFIEWLMDYTGKQVHTWPAIAEMRTAQPKIERIRKFLAQIFLTEEALLGAKEGDPGFLRFALANLSEVSDPAAETALEILDKRRLNELAGHKVEKGIIVTHARQLWFKLLQIVGLSAEDVERVEPKEPTRNLIAELSDIYSNAEWQTAIGAFACNEKIVSEENKVISQLLKNNFSDDKSVNAFLHRSATEGKNLTDAKHMLEKVSFDRESKELVWEGFKRALDLRNEFYNGLIKYLEN